MKKFLSVLASMAILFTSTLLLSVQDNENSLNEGFSVSGAEGDAMRDITTMALVKDMGLGINLGNTFESQNDWTANPTVNDFETAWGSPTVTKAIIKGYADAGFKTVRIPVAWSNLMTDMTGPNPTYTINPAYIARVKEVTDWVTEFGMYAIINIHWDGGWWKDFPTQETALMDRYEKMWIQIADAFKDYSDYVMFESLNEEGKWDDVWNPWSGNDAAKSQVYGILNRINQKFVDTVRASGGNNPERHLLIAGYDTNIDRTVDTAFVMPADNMNRCAVSVHYYDPFGFTHLDKDESWAKMSLIWGTQEEINALNTQFDKLKTRFVDNGIPVIIGEYGMAQKGRDESEIRKYTVAVAKAAYERDICPILWDVQLDEKETQYYYNRKTEIKPIGMVDKVLEEELKKLTDNDGGDNPPATTAPTTTSTPVATTAPDVTTTPSVTTAPTGTTSPPDSTAPSTTTSDSGFVEPSYKIGDVNGDSNINVHDALEILCFLAKFPCMLSNSDVDSIAWKAACITYTSKKNNMPTISDALQILMYVAGMECELRPNLAVNG